MARVPVATDDFTVDDLATNYENGPGVLSGMAIVGGGLAQAGTTNVVCAAYHLDSVTDSQYSRVVIQNIEANDVAAAVVCGQTGTSEHYLGAWSRFDGAWVISIVDSAGTITNLATDSTGFGAPAVGDELILEREGAALRLYTVIGGVETLRVSTTDATYTGGLAGMLCIGIGSTGHARLTELEIGDIVSVDDNLSELPQGVITDTQFAPSVTATENNFSELPVSLLELVRFAPNAITTEHNFSELPVVALSLESFAPTIVSTDLNISELPSGALTLTSFAPDATVTEHNFSELPVGALSLSSLAPDAVTTENNVSQLPSGALTLAAFAPEIVVTDIGANVSELPVATLTLTTFGPIVVSTRHYCYVPQKRDPTFSLFYARTTTPSGLLRATQSGEIREIEQALDGGVPPWEL